MREESNQRKIKAKNIDILDVKQAIKDGQLEITVEYNPFHNNYSVYLKDRITGESALLFVTETSEILKMPK